MKLFSVDVLDAFASCETVMSRFPHTEKSRSFKRKKSMSRLLREIKGRWFRRAHDEHWVFVEVQSAITDRVLKE